jgi:hypothetical protein
MFLFLSMFLILSFRFPLKLLVLRFHLAVLVFRLKMLLLLLLLGLLHPLRLPDLGLFLLVLLLPVLFLLLVPGFPMLLDLRPLLILLLPLMSEFLSLLVQSGLITLDAPGSLPFPAAITVPALPVLSELSVRNPFIVPPVSVPIMAPVVSSPTRVYIEIETWNVVIITPAPVIIV